MTTKPAAHLDSSAISGGNVIPFPGFSQHCGKPNANPEVVIPIAEKPLAEKTGNKTSLIKVTDQPLSTDEVLKDLETLPAMALRKKYAREASSHRNMLTRAPAKGGVIAAEFVSFKSFLLHVGIIPGAGKWTLDRINNDCPDYGPGLVRWATPTQQNNNKGDTILLQANGQVHPLTTWAEETGQDPNTLRARRKKGWNDHDVVYGRRRSRTSVPEPAPGVWSALLVSYLVQHIEKFEASYLASRLSMPDGKPEPRDLWLAAVAWHRAATIAQQIVERFDDAHYRGVDPEPDSELDEKSNAWSETHERAAQSFRLRTGIEYRNVREPWKVNRGGRKDQSED